MSCDCLCVCERGGYPHASHNSINHCPQPKRKTQKEYKTKAKLKPKLAEMGVEFRGGHSSQRYNRNAVTSSQSGAVSRGVFKGA